MESPLYLNLLWLVPIAVWLTTREKSQLFKSTIRGVSIGLVVSPASLGLYGFYFVGPLAAILGMLGLVLSFHSFVGYEVAISFNLIPSHTVITGTERLPIEIINAVFWAVVYGLLGLFIGYLKNKRKIALTKKSTWTN